MPEVVIVDAIRTPVGKYGGALAQVRPDDLAAHVIRELVERNPTLNVAEIEEVILGAANQAGEDNRNVARMAALLADLPESVAGVTVNRLCASGLQAIMDASKNIIAGIGDVFIAGGVESMSRAPYVLSKGEVPYDKGVQMFDTSLGWRFTNPALAAKHYPFAMGETAENLAERYNISRREQDEFTYNSQLKFQEAKERGVWEDEIVPVVIPQRKGDSIIVSEDEQPRLSSVEVLGKLRPAFNKDGSVTAGNSSSLNDGAAAMLVMSAEKAKQYGLKPIAKVVSMAVAGVDPAIMGIGPVPATQKALKRAGLTIKDIDLIELNEAFAVQALAVIRDLELDMSIINVNGGSIAIGHPLGCSGTRILTTLLYEMKRREDARYGLATMCVGVGQGSAIIVEKL